MEEVKLKNECDDFVELLSDLFHVNFSKRL